MNQFEILMKAREDTRSLHAENETDKEIIAYNENNERIIAKIVESEKTRPVIENDAAIHVLTGDERPLTNAEKQEAVKLVIRFSDESAGAKRDTMERTRLAMLGIAEMTSASMAAYIQSMTTVKPFLENFIEQECAASESLARALNQMTTPRLIPQFPDTLTKALLPSLGAFQMAANASINESIQGWAKAAHISDAIAEMGRDVARTDGILAAFGRDSLRASELLANYAKGFDPTAETLAKISFPRISIPSRTLDLSPIPYPIVTESPRRWSEPEARWERRELIAREVDPKVLDFISEMLKRPDLKSHPTMSALLYMPFDALVEWAKERLKQSNGHSSIFLATFSAPARSGQTANAIERAQIQTSQPQRGDEILVQDDFVANYSPDEIRLLAYSMFPTFDDLEYVGGYKAGKCVTVINNDPYWDDTIHNPFYMLIRYLYRDTLEKAITIHVFAMFGGKSRLKVTATVESWRRLSGDYEKFKSKLGEKNKRTSKAKRGANDDTREKLKELVRIRAQSKRNEKITIAWTTACQQAGITPSTAKTHLPELNRRWNDANYNPNADDL